MHIGMGGDGASFQRGPSSISQRATKIQLILVKNGPKERCAIMQGSGPNNNNKIN